MQNDDNSGTVDSEAAAGDTAGIGRGTTFAVRGEVMDAETRLPLGEVKVDLTNLGGAPLSSAFTDASGNFGFENLRTGSYFVVVKLNGYKVYSERVDLFFGPALPIQAELHKSTEQSSTVSSGQPIITVHDLAIPEKARESMEKGMQLLMKSDYSGSVKAFQQAIDAYPNYNEAYTKMGAAYMAMKDEKRAEPALRKSIELSNQKDGEAIVYLARLLSDEGHFADADALARKSVELNSKSWATNLELARALYGENQYPEAEKYALASVQDEPDHPGVYLLLINIHFYLNDGKDALDEMNTYLKLVPNGPVADQVRTARGKLQKQLTSAQSGPAQQNSSDAPPSLRK